MRFNCVCVCLCDYWERNIPIYAIYAIGSSVLKTFNNNNILKTF